VEEKLEKIKGEKEISVIDFSFLKLNKIHYYIDLAG